MDAERLHREIKVQLLLINSVVNANYMLSQMSAEAEARWGVYLSRKDCAAICETDDAMRAEEPIPRQVSRHCV